ncbi:MAG TPA: HAMP domain-containing sensor histidine kinase [Mobilitalea sp.]|nr:HAMP domain-containing sensor histidine kinase [Mobilitalea sp.]
MLRNKDFKVMIIILSFITISGVILAFLIDPLAVVLLLLMALLMMSIIIVYTQKRYCDIDNLSKYLRKIYNGDYSLDIRDNMEGELSILRNDVYKVTLILSKQNELLKSEKEQLATALSDISHQLKTPLTSMMVMADILSRDKLESEKRKEFTKNLMQQLERMEWLLTSLLKLSRLDAGTVEFKKETIPVERLVRQAVKPLLIPMELKEQELIIKGDSLVTFVGDLNWTSEALINILKNCMEHTRIGGSISIIYGENPLYTEIVISDNGSGIANDDLPFIFKRFFRGKNAGDESVGIGLAMAKSIITSQNGDTSATSQLNQGTKFSVKFYKQTT